MDQNRFFPLLISLALLVLSAPFFLNTPLSGWIFNTMGLLAVLSALYSISNDKRYFTLVALIAVINIIIHAVNALTAYQHLWLMLIDHVTLLLLISLVIYFVFFALFERHRITAGSIYAAMCIYLILGIFFGLMYASVELLIPGSFHFKYVALQSETPMMLKFHLVTFSYATLTTVGNAQIVAIKPFAEALVVIEEIVGVFYLAVLIARLVTGLSVVYKEQI